jgi:hypothetical protein
VWEQHPQIKNAVSAPPIQQAGDLAGDYLGALCSKTVIDSLCSQSYSGNSGSIHKDPSLTMSLTSAMVKKHVNEEAHHKWEPATALTKR